MTTGEVLPYPPAPAEVGAGMPAPGSWSQPKVAHRAVPQIRVADAVAGHVADREDAVRPHPSALHQATAGVRVAVHVDAQINVADTGHGQQVDPAVTGDVARRPHLVEPRSPAGRDHDRRAGEATGAGAWPHVAVVVGFADAIKIRLAVARVVTGREDLAIAGEVDVGGEIRDLIDSAPAGSSVPQGGTASCAVVGVPDGFVIRDTGAAVGCTLGFQFAGSLGAMFVSDRTGCTVSSGSLPWKRAWRSSPLPTSATCT